MSDEDYILNATVVYSQEEVQAVFQEACESEAEAPGFYTPQVKLAAADLCQMLNRKNGAVQV